MEKLNKKNRKLEIMHCTYCFAYIYFHCCSWKITKLFFGTFHKALMDLSFLVFSLMNNSCSTLNKISMIALAKHKLSNCELSHWPFTFLVILPIIPHTYWSLNIYIVTLLLGQDKLSLCLVSFSLLLKWTVENKENLNIL